MATYNISQDDIDELMDLYFKQPKILYEHLFAPYNQLIEETIPYCLTNEQNNFYQNIVDNNIYHHGIKCSNVRIKPPTYDNDNEIKFPSDARKNHLSYFATVVVDMVQVLEKTDIKTGEKTIKDIGSTLKEEAIANIPIMVKSKYCSTQIKKDLHGECRYDPGGYFIVKGQEKIVISIEKMVDNKILVFTKKEPSYPEQTIYTAQINSKENDWADNLQIVTIKNRKDNDIIITTSSLVEVPLFILFRALGVESDQEIISKITYDLDDIKMINLLRASMSYSTDDAGFPIKTKEEAIEYLASKLRKNKMISQSDEALAKHQRRMMLEKILRKDFLPHLKEDMSKKICFLGNMVHELLSVWLKRRNPDDRDALQNKRIETPGVLIGQLFKQYWKKMLNEIGKLFAKKNQSDENPINILNQIKPAIIEQGIKTALTTGIWGMNKTKKGVSQSLQRLSWPQAISIARRVMAPSLDSSTQKVTSIRQAQNLQMQFLCVTGDTEILMGNKYNTKQIKDIINDDSVTSIHPEELYEEVTGIHNYFRLLPDKLYELITESGRKIKATKDHPFLVKEDNILVWKKLEDLNIKDNVVIRHTEKYIADENTLELIISDKDISLLYKYELTDLGYINVNISLEKQKILARLVGTINTNGTIYNNKGYYEAIFYINDEIDILQLKNDISKLGFNLSNININDKNVLVYGSLGYLLSLVGGYVNTDLIKINPKWILDSELSIKREYLSSFQEYMSEGLQYNKYKSHIDSISQITLNKNLKETENYIQEIKNMFYEFKINTFITIMPIDSENSKVCLSFSNTLENIIKYVDIIGYRYNNQKRISVTPFIECVKIMHFTNKNDIDFSNDNILENGCVTVPILSLNEIAVEPVYDFTTFSENHSFVASSFVTHNCCAETPEGQKIGIVKSLAMMASITSQNSSQLEILTSILKTFDIKHPADINPLHMKSHIKIFINGNWMGVCKLKDGFEIYNNLKFKRRTNVIDKYTTICMDYSRRELKMYYDGGRLIRPILVVNNNKLNFTKQVADDVKKEIELQDFAKGWKKILTKHPNLVEYEDVESSNFIMCADRFYRLDEVESNHTRKIEHLDTDRINRYGDYRWVRYTHCDFNSWTLLGIIAGNIPFSNHNHSGRNIIHFSQAKQAISGPYLTSYKDRMDISQILYYPQVPIVTTKTMEYNNCLDLPYGENAVVAIASYNGYNQEDSMIFNQSAIDRGIFRADTLKKYPCQIEKNPTTNRDDIFTKPDKNKVADMKHGNYNKLNDKGFVPEETEIENEDFIVGKISPIQPTGDNNKVYKDSSEIFKSNVPGVIDRVHTGVYNTEGYEMYNVRIRMERIPVIGDKFCLTCEHEVLTTKGWKYINQITLDDTVACLNNKEEIYYAKPSKLWKFEHKGLMYKLESKEIDLITTFEHKMFVKEENEECFKLDKVNNIIGKNVHYKQNGKWIKKVKETIKINDIEFLTNDWLSFYIMYLTKGYINESDNSVKFIINDIDSQITFEKLYHSMNLNIVKVLDNEWHFDDENIIKYLDISSDWVYELNETQSRYLLDNMIITENVSRLALQCGWSSEGVVINKSNNEPLLTNKKESMIDYDGFVYCIEVPDHIFYTRLNKKSCWTGNSNRHGQKGTLGISLPQKDMPFSADGLVPDLIMNPHCLPSRMTIGQMVECVASKLGAIDSHFVDGTPYCDYDVRKIPEALEKLGFNKYGNEVLYCGMTGKKIEAEIFMGPTYQVRLKHMTADKYHSRSRGPRQALTRQPLEGRSRDGGLKIGEMEKDAMIAHGMGQFLKERMMETSDIHKVHICDQCGLIASKVIDKDYYWCKSCHNSTRISAVVMPYAAKLLIQELMSVNILPRIRTERTIYSDET